MPDPTDYRAIREAAQRLAKATAKAEEFLGFIPPVQVQAAFGEAQTCLADLLSPEVVLRLVERAEAADRLEAERRHLTEIARADDLTADVLEAMRSSTGALRWHRVMDKYQAIRSALESKKAP